MQVHECAQCPHLLLKYRVDGSLRAAICLMRRDARPKEGVNLEEMAQCPDRARAARRAGAV